VELFFNLKVLVPLDLSGSFKLDKKKTEAKKKTVPAKKVTAVKKPTAKKAAPSKKKTTPSYNEVQRGSLSLLH